MHLLILLLFIAVPAWRLIRISRQPDRVKCELGERAEYLLSGALGPRRQNERVNRIGGRLAQSARLDVEFFVLPGPMVNAVSLPHGQVYIWQGLLGHTAEDDDMLAGVLAHELGHVIHDHHLRAYEAAAMLSLVLGVLGRPWLRGLSRGLVNQVIQRGFSRSREWEADETAVELMDAAGFGARGLIRLFDTLPRQQAIQGMLGTHPDPDQRAARLREQLGEIPRTDEKVIPFPGMED
jgi:predicted Zn-dependent protease